MTRKKQKAAEPGIREELSQGDEGMLFLDGPEFDAAIIGTALIWAPAESGGGAYHHDVVLYDRDKVLKVLMAQGMDEEEAQEWYDFNTTGGYVGPYTPAFATLLHNENS